MTAPVLYTAIALMEVLTEDAVDLEQLTFKLNLIIATFSAHFSIKS